LIAGRNKNVEKIRRGYCLNQVGEKLIFANIYGARRCHPRNPQAASRAQGVAAFALRQPAKTGLQVFHEGRHRFPDQKRPDYLRFLRAGSFLCAAVAWDFQGYLQLLQFCLN